MYGTHFAIRLLAIAFVATTMPAAATAWANSETCAERSKVLQHLAGQYKEAPVAMGLANNGGIIEILRSPDSATFTIIVTMPDGVSCMIAAGQSWESLPHRLARGSGI